MWKLPVVIKSPEKKRCKYLYKFILFIYFTNLFSHKTFLLHFYWFCKIATHISFFQRSNNPTDRLTVDRCKSSLPICTDELNPTD
jgi:hypothetical protein